MAVSADPDPHSTHLVRPMDPHPCVFETSQDSRCWMSVTVGPAGRNQRVLRRRGSEKRAAGRRSAPVMTNLQNIDVTQNRHQGLLNVDVGISSEHDVDPLP